MTITVPGTDHVERIDMGKVREIMDRHGMTHGQAVRALLRKVEG